ncbi:MAG: T9SS type A sorting domain-containing protein [bacterium]|nr:T9SS type A sorting domain-containing protein [bacterium]
MMYKLFKLFYFSCLALLFQGTATAQWTRIYGGSSDDYGFSVEQTTDGGFIIAGWTYSFGVGTPDSSSNFYLIKIDSLGDTLWTKTFGGTSDDFAWSVQQTQDSGFIIAGYTMSFGSGEEDFYLIKTNLSGDTLWTKTYGGNYVDYGYSVEQTTDSGFIIAGYTQSFGAGGDIYLIKTNSSGDTLWTKTYGGSSEDYAYSVEQTTDGGFIITGLTHSFGTVGGSVYLIKTNSSGDTLWTRTYGGSNSDWGYSVQQTTDGGFIITGMTYSLGGGYQDVYLIKTDYLGDTLWTKTFGGTGNDWGYSVEQTTDGGFIITGCTQSFGIVGGNVYLIKTNSSGDTLWTRTYGGSNSDWGYSVHQTTDGGFIISGDTRSFGTGSWDIYLIKTDSLGSVGIEENRSEATSSHNGINMEISPNPSFGKVVIKYTLPAQANTQLNFYDLSGRIIKSLCTDTQEKGCHTVNVSLLPKGIYLLNFSAGNYKETKKLILMK